MRLVFIHRAASVQLHLPVSCCGACQVAQTSCSAHATQSSCDQRHRRCPHSFQSMLSAQVLLEHREDVKLESTVVARDYLTVFERCNGQRSAIVYQLPKV